MRRQVKRQDKKRHLPCLRPRWQSTKGSNSFQNLTKLLCVNFQFIISSRCQILYKEQSFKLRYFFQPISTKKLIRKRIHQNVLRRLRWLIRNVVFPAQYRSARRQTVEFLAIVRITQGNQRFHIIRANNLFCWLQSPRFIKTNRSIFHADCDRID